MTLLNLSFVTRSIINLIERRVLSSPAWQLGAPLAVLPDPPDLLAGTNVIGLYLYHIGEDSHYKNLPAPGNERAPIRFSPMAVDLYYQLTAHCEGEENTEVRYREQLLMGLAMKAFHDFPILSDATVLNGSPIFVQGLRDNDNRLRISLLPVSQEQAVEYWTAGSRPLRVAAYYQVKVALFEPEELTERSTRVLRYGVFAFPSGTPRLLGSRNNLSFTVPGESEARTVELQPAQAPYDGEVVFFGHDLSGDRITLALRSANWDNPVEVDVDWSVTASQDRVFAVVQAAAGSETVLPGMYTASVRVAKTRQAQGGLSREFISTSNETPFTITPRIDAITNPTPAGEATVTGFIFEHPDLPAEDVQVFVGADRLEQTAAGPLAPGQFTISDATSLSLRLPAGLSSGELAPFRLIIHGAESPPRWILIP